jgi:hypothetical protein
MDIGSPTSYIYGRMRRFRPSLVPGDSFRASMISEICALILLSQLKKMALNTKCFLWGYSRTPLKAHPSVDGPG